MLRRRIISVNKKPNYLTFIANEDGTFKFSGVTTAHTLSYSLNSGVTWTTLASNTDTPTIRSGETIMWKGELTPDTNKGIGKFSSTASFDVSGTPMTLIYGNNTSKQNSLSGKTSAFYGLFSNCTKLMGAEELELPATKLASYCYRNMFQGCTMLTTVPQLPATALGNNCYDGMFMGCTSLTTVPSDLLPDTTLASNCYESMFADCTKLANVPQLPSTTARYGCYYGMFSGCTSLTTVQNDLLN